MTTNLSASLQKNTKFLSPSNISKKREEDIPKIGVDIWGSCVSRDSLEFANNIEISKYCARSSIISAVAPPAAMDTIKILKLEKDIRPFYRRVIDEDLHKTALQDFDTQNILVLDLIEERVPVGLTLCGTYITYSQTLHKYSSNGKQLLQRIIQPYSDEYINLFITSIDKFAKKIGDKQVFIHKAFYAKGEWEFEKQNNILELYYERASKVFTNSTTIEIDSAFRISSPDHKWGIAPYHYIDEYYRQFLKEFSKKSGIEIFYKKNFSLQNN